MNHWLKRKRAVEVEAFVSGCKPGGQNNGHTHLVGAVEFSTRGEDGTDRPIAWVSGWTDAERAAMTRHGVHGDIQLNPAYLGRRAIVSGHEPSAKSQRLRHARIRHWLDG